MNELGAKYIAMYIKRRKKTDEEKAIEQEERARMLAMFMEIWNERPRYSEISGKWLGKEPLTTLFHHILPKSVYKNAKFAKDNIILLTPDEHQEVENGYRTIPNEAIIKEKLLQKYGKN